MFSLIFPMSLPPSWMPSWNSLPVTFGSLTIQHIRQSRRTISSIGKRSRSFAMAGGISFALLRPDLRILMTGAASFGKINQEKHKKTIYQCRSIKGGKRMPESHRSSFHIFFLEISTHRDLPPPFLPSLHLSAGWFQPRVSKILYRCPWSSPTGFRRIRRSRN